MPSPHSHHDQLRLKPGQGTTEVVLALAAESPRARVLLSRLSTLQIDFAALAALAARLDEIRLYGNALVKEFGKSGSTSEFVRRVHAELPCQVCRKVPAA